MLNMELKNMKHGAEKNVKRILLRRLSSHLLSEVGPPPQSESSGRTWEQICGSSGPAALCPDWTNRIHYRLCCNHMRQQCEENILQVVSLYLLTLSSASASGGGTMKQAPGRVLVLPLFVCSSQFLLSELDFRFRVSPRLTVSWNTRR